jgi:hypothetical protein
MVIQSTPTHSTIKASYFTHSLNACGFGFLMKAVMDLRIVADFRDWWNGQEIRGTTFVADDSFNPSQPYGNRSLVIRYPWFLSQHYKINLLVSNLCLREILLDNQFPLCGMKLLFKITRIQR